MVEVVTTKPCDAQQDRYSLQHGVCR